VDTQGYLLAALVTPADVPDVDGAYGLLPAAKAAAPTLAHVWVDGGYEGDWAVWAAEEQGVTVEVVRRPPGTRGFAVQARRWVVERSIAWLSRHRRLTRDFERYEASSELLIFLASCHLLLKRLKPAVNN
jgi:putative transposase